MLWRRKSSDTIVWSRISVEQRREFFDLIRTDNEFMDVAGTRPSVTNPFHTHPYWYSYAKRRSFPHTRLEWIHDRHVSETGFASLMTSFCSLSDDWRRFEVIAVEPILNQSSFTMRCNWGWKILSHFRSSDSIKIIFTLDDAIAQHKKQYVYDRRRAEGKETPV